MRMLAIVQPVVDGEERSTMNRREYLVTHLFIPASLGVIGGFCGAVAQGVIQEHLKDHHRLTLSLQRSTETRPASGNSQLMAYEYTGVVANEGDFSEENVVAQLVIRGEPDGEEIRIQDRIVTTNPTLLLDNLDYQEDWDRPYTKVFEARLEQLAPGESIRFYIQAVQLADFVGETRSSTDWDEAFLGAPAEI